MNRSLKALGALLTYPDEVLVAAIPEIRAVLEADYSLPTVLRPPLRSLLDYLSSTDPWVLQESYVECFDSGRATSLHLFEHVHGESRDRGQAMVDLRTLYEQLGLTMVPEELPDYLPAFLEFCSLCDPAQAAEYLGECALILDAIGTRLSERRSPYAALFPMLLSFAGPASTETTLPVKPELSLDEEWAEEPAFSPPQGAC